MSTFSRIPDTIHDIFDTHVGHNNINIVYRDGRQMEVAMSANSSSKSPNCILLNFSFYGREENNIYINHLDNCEEKSVGLKLLNLVEDLAKRIGSNEISLVDKSKLKMGIGQSVPLNTLYNLTTGQSWYNKMGYICREEGFLNYHEEQYKENKEKITRTNVNDFVFNEVEPIVNEPMDKLLEEIQMQFPELDPNKKIQEYFNIVKDQLQKYSDGKLGQNKDVSLLVKLIKLIDNAQIMTTYPTTGCLLIKKIKSELAGGMRKKNIGRKKTKTRKAIKSQKIRKMRTQEKKTRKIKKK